MAYVSALSIRLHPKNTEGVSDDVALERARELARRAAALAVIDFINAGPCKE